MRALLFTIISSFTLLSCAVQSDSADKTQADESAELGTSEETSDIKVGRGCIRTGCSGQICSDEVVYTTCEWREEYACYASAACARQPSGQCGWTMTPELEACLASGGAI